MLAEIIFFELFLTGLLLFGIMFYNNVILYQLELKDSISVMLIVGMAIHVIDYLWVLADGKLAFRVANYLLATGYSLGIAVCVMALAKFTMKNFDIRFRFRQSKWILFRLPVLLIAICGLVSPRIPLFYSVDQDGYIQYMPLYNYVYTPLMVVYATGPILLALYQLTQYRRKSRKEIRLAVHVLVFAVLVVFTYLLQFVILSLDEQYISVGLCWAVGLIYFTTNANTDRMVENMNTMAAVEADLNIAASIQLGSLPATDHAFATHPDIGVNADIDTAKEVGGDFFDFFEIDDHHICFVVADVSGKGVPAALFMMTTKTMIKDHAMMKSSTADIFTNVNRLLSENNEAGMFATAWIGILDTDTKVMQFTNAGHNAPCVKTDAEGYQLLKKKHGLFLAGMEDTEYRESELALKSGDKLFLYTDGLTEAHNIAGKLYGEERMLACLNASQELEGEALLSKVKEDVQGFSAGTEQFDDITMMLISIS